AGGVEVGDEALVAVRLEQRGVGHRHERHVDALAAGGEGLAVAARWRAPAGGPWGGGAVPMPWGSARPPARRITGPSASGSEKGKPISTRSAPPATAASASDAGSAPATRGRTS